MRPIRISLRAGNPGLVSYAETLRTRMRADRRGKPILFQREEEEEVGEGGEPPPPPPVTQSSGGVPSVIFVIDLRKRNRPKLSGPAPTPLLGGKPRGKSIPPPPPPPPPTGRTESPLPWYMEDLGPSRDIARQAREMAERARSYGDKETASDLEFIAGYIEGRALTIESEHNESRQHPPGSSERSEHEERAANAQSEMLAGAYSAMQAIINAGKSLGGYQ